MPAKSWNVKSAGAIVAGLLACLAPHGCSLFDQSEYNPAAPTSMQVAARASVPAASTVAAVATSASAIPAAAPVAAPLAGVAAGYAADLPARLDAIESRMADMQAHGVRVTRGQVEWETLGGMVGSALVAVSGFIGGRNKATAAAPAPAPWVPPPGYTAPYAPGYAAPVGAAGPVPGGVQGVRT